MIPFVVRSLSRRVLFSVLLLPFFVSPVFSSVEAYLADLSIEQLLQVKVSSASKYEQRASQAPSAVSVVTADEIRRYGYRTLAEVLSGERGFFSTTDRNYTYIGSMIVTTGSNVGKTDLYFPEFDIPGTSDGDSGARLSNSPKLMTGVRMSYPVFDRGATLGLEQRYMGKRLTLQGNELHGFFLTNLTLSSNSLGKGWSASLGVYNVFDHALDDPGAEEHTQDFIRQNGRLFRLMVTKAFY